MTELRHIVCPHRDAVNRVPAGRVAEAPKCGRCADVLFAARPLEPGAMSAADMVRWVRANTG